MVEAGVGVDADDDVEEDEGLLFAQQHMVAREDGGRVSDAEIVGAV